MKNIILCALICSQIVYGYAAIDTNLKYGTSSNKVLELQDFLVSKGLLNVSPSGFFGLLTLNAVKAYQANNNIPSTGYVGNLTRTAINNELTIALQPTVQAEIEEQPVNTGTSPQNDTIISQPVIQQTVQTIVQTPQVIDPTCTLDVEQITVSGDKQAKIIWTSQNATKGIVTVSIVANPKIELTLDPVQGGELHHLQVLSLSGRLPEDINKFSAIFFGNGKSVTCEKTLQVN